MSSQQSSLGEGTDNDNFQRPVSPCFLFLSLGTGLVTLGSPHFAGPMDMVSSLVVFLETANISSMSPTGVANGA